MTRPQQRVIIYTKGLRSKTSAQRNDEYRAAMPEYFECPKCKRHVKKGEAGNLKKHYADYPNKIHCPAGVDKQSGSTSPSGLTRSRQSDTIT